MTNFILATVETVPLSQFHTLSRTTVNLDKKDSHEIEHGKYMLSKPQVEALGNAAGVSIVESGYVDVGIENVTERYAVVELVRPDGTKVRQKKTYRLDLRFKERDGVDGARMLSIVRRNYNSKKIHHSIEGDERWEKAREMALNEIISMNAFATERAESGAALRATRSILNLKSLYTVREIEQPFVVYTAKYDYAKMALAGGALKEKAERVLLSGLAQSLGLKTDTVLGLLSQAEEVAVEENEREDLRVLTPDEQQDLFEFLTKQYDVKSRAGADKICMGLFDAALSQITVRQDRLIREGADLLMAAREHLNDDELSEFKGNLRQMTNLAVATGDSLKDLMDTSWNEDAVDNAQLPLPGMET